MGYDLEGIKPKNKKGEYFYNNVWYWRPLWAFICEITPELSKRDCERGQYNAGLVIKGKKHKAIIRSLREYLANSENEKFEPLIEKAIGEQIERTFNQVSRILEMEKNGRKVTIDMSSWGIKNVKNFLEFCENNEGFEIW